MTFNARGVGLSTGSQPIPGFGGNEGEDFAAIEKAMSQALGVEEVWRVVSPADCERLIGRDTLMARLLL